MFSLVCALPFPDSAEACASLFDWRPRQRQAHIGCGALADLACEGNGSAVPVNHGAGNRQALTRSASDTFGSERTASFANLSCVCICPSSFFGLAISRYTAQEVSSGSFPVELGEGDLSVVDNRAATESPLRLPLCQRHRHCLGRARLQNGCSGQGWVVDQHLSQTG